MVVDCRKSRLFWMVNARFTSFVGSSWLHGGADEHDKKIMLTSVVNATGIDFDNMPASSGALCNIDAEPAPGERITDDHRHSIRDPDCPKSARFQKRSSRRL